MLVQGSIKNRSVLALNLVGKGESVKTSDAEKHKGGKETDLDALLLQEEDSQLTCLTTATKQRFSDSTNQRFADLCWKTKLNKTENSFYQHWLSKS